jgi:alpha-1,3-rhamnosyl/mannosyltransferase
MACGCPVITTNKASLPEVAGNAALYLSDPQNSKELAALLCEIIKPDVHQRLLSNSKKRVSQFSWKNTARKTYEIIKKLCS